MKSIGHSDDSYKSSEFFAIANAVDILARSAELHNRQAFKAASDALDTTPSDLLRGTAYLCWLLSQVDESARHPESERSAKEAIAGMNALAAVLIELQNRADIAELVHEQALAA